MGRYFALTLGLETQAQFKPKPKTIASKSRVNWGFWLLLLLVVLSVTYLFQVNGSSTKGYEIKKLERRLFDLKETNKRLELEAASFQSTQYIESTVKILNLVPAAGIRYVGEDDYAYKR